ncbi:hypothetical protein HED60_22175 [Planctomycetales bacterium ZRK34]|nr:hypothetical protein HED60_22175 [Planctomycetales bacterium ZRK34]
MTHQSNMGANSEFAVDLPTQGDWFVLHTRSRQEKALTADLLAMNVGVYLPLQSQIRFHGQRKVKARLPLFPGYLFLRGTREQAFLADRTRRVANIITVNDQQTIDCQLRNLHLALSQEAPLDPYPYLQKGTWVEVTAGPFRGLQGVVENRLSADRLLLQIDMLGRAMSLEIDPSLLQVLDDRP